jgi:hypothetical protein
VNPAIESALEKLEEAISDATELRDALLPGHPQGPLAAGLLIRLEEMKLSLTGPSAEK